MRGDVDRVTRIAGAISDGAPVDWKAEASADPQLARRLENLRLLESIAAFHETPADLEPRDEPLPGDESGAGLKDLSGEPTVGLDVAAGSGSREPISEWAHLQIISKIGEGACGEVFRAHDAKLGRDFALKLLRSDVKMDPRRFLREARRLARVRHPNVLVVHGAAESGGRVGLWTDLLEGETLEAKLQREGRSGQDEVAAVGADLCRALAAVHGAGLVHRDVKTSNIMREEGGRIVLMDFSAAVELPGSGHRSEFEPVTGTPLFMAPEILEGREADKASDIYSLGVVLYRLISGRFPIQAKNFRELREAHRERKLLPLLDARPDTHPALARAVEKALSSDPSGRYQTVGEMQRALSAAAGRPSIEPPSRNRILRVTVALAAAMALLAGAYAIRAWLAPAPLRLDASFYRVPANEPTVQERLLPGGRLDAGDQVFLELRPGDEVHAYVLNEDAGGRVVVMFPLPSLDLKNPLEPGALHRLPGAVLGEEKYWDMGGARGRETFLVIASRTRLEGFEESLGDARRVDEGGGVDIQRAKAEIRTILRGVEGLSDAPSSEAARARGRLASLTRGLTGQATAADGVWVWMIELENAGP